MKFPTLTFVRNQDKVEVYCFRKDGSMIDHIVEAHKFVMVVTRDGFTMNLDLCLTKRWLFRFATLWLHEWLHWLFPRVDICVLIHRISKMTKGLLL